MFVTVQPDLIALLEQGFTCQEKGDLAGAEKKYLEVLSRDEHNEFALNLLGVVCNRQSRPEEALKYLRKALRINPDDAETHNNLGLAYKDLKQFAEAQVAFERSIELNPRRPTVLNNLGNALAGTGRHDDAVGYFEQALRFDPNYVDCLTNFAVSLKELGRTKHALQVVDHAIGVDPENSQAFNYKGEILLRTTEYERAKEAFERAIELDDNIVARINISTALKQLGKEQEAIETLQDVLALEENNSEAHNHLGVLMEQLGDTQRAAEHFRLAIRHTPNHASSFYQLSKLKDQRLTQSEVDKINSLLEDPQTLDIFRSSLFFALACEYEKREDFETSIDYFIKAQRVRAIRHPYDDSLVSQYIEVSKRVFPVDRDHTLPSHDGQPVPIFVVGMPRSGTTLTEQIIASHSQITGAGEVGFINDLAERSSAMTQQPFPESIRHLSGEQVQQLRQAYLSRMTGRFGLNRIIVDKNPLNFNFAGAIATIFPEAKILYCRRDPMDNCVSIFRLPFDDTQGYSHDLTALGQYYRRHAELMEYWQSIYPGRILQVQYEDTVEDLEGQARQMLNFIGVDFEEQVLQFFDNERIVMTPSAEQVRQPIYKSSVGRWRRYGSALDPLLRALGVGNR